MKFFVLICSCQKYRDRRQVVRLTWLPRLLPNMQYGFVIGRGPPPPADEPDVFQVDAPDTYEELAAKIQAAFRYTLQFEWDWLFKLDEDTYFVPERLHLAFETAVLAPHYPVVSGATRDPRPGEPDWIGAESYDEAGYAHGGAGYLLTRRLVERLVTSPITPDLMDSEDGWVGKGCRLWTRLYVTPLLHHHNDRGVWPTPDNQVITCHGNQTPELQWKFHARYLCAKPSVPLLV